MLRRCALALLLVLLAAASARATLLVYEPFDYPTGILATRTATGFGLTGTYASGSVVPPILELQVESPGLDFGSFIDAPSAKGGLLSQDQGTTSASVTAALANPVDIAPGKEIFFSALFVFDDSLNGNRFASIVLENPANGDTLTFGESVVGSGAIRISVSTAATGGNPVGPGADNLFTDGQRLFLLGRYQNGAAPDSDRLDLVGYDTALATELPATFDPADPDTEFRLTLGGLTLDLDRITAIRFAIRGTANNFLDELRVGTTYADVVPEPAPGVLVLAGLAGMGLRGARRRSARAR